MAGLLKLREEIHNRILRLRSMETLILRPLFDRVWEDSSEEERTKILALLDQADRNGLGLYIQKHASFAMEEKSSKELKNIARRFGILNWSRMTKDELVISIVKEEMNDRGGSAPKNGGAVEGGQDARACAK